MDRLFEWGIVKKGDKLYVKNNEDQIGIAIDSKYVEADGEKLTYNTWGKKVTGWSSIQTYTWIVKEENKKTLDELRREKIEELEGLNDN